MIIKSSSEYKIFVVILLSSVLLYAILLISEFRDYYFPVVTAFILAVIVIRYWISVCRTFVLSPEGCTIKFLCFCLNYKWTDFKTMRIEDYSNRSGYRLHYTSGVILSCRRIKKKTWLMPAVYSLFLHPFSFIYIHFDPHIEFNRWDVRCPDLYVVEENEFLSQLMEWGVTLEDNRNKTV